MKNFLKNKTSANNSSENFQSDHAITTGHFVFIITEILLYDENAKIHKKKKFNTGCNLIYPEFKEL